MSAMTEPKATHVQTAQRVTKPSVQSMLTDPKMKAQLAAALPKHLTADRMARIVLTELRRVPKLLDCEPASLMGAVMQCAQIGLEPGNGLGHAYLIPFGREVQLIIGYRGFLDLARRSGQIVSISARAVYAGDRFEYAYGLNEKLVHEPAPNRAKDAELTFVYAVASLKDGGHQFEVMSRADVEKVRAKSKSGGSGPWKDHYEEMAKKTAIRRLFKYLPVSVELQRAVMADEYQEAGVSQDNALMLDGQAFPAREEREPGEESALDHEPGDVGDK
jgi:recombination protein RecT